jgi:hypothetical protein
MINLFKRNKKRVLSYYTSIDELPVYNWFKIQETSDLNYLVKGSETGEVLTLASIWQNLYREFLDTFGISDALRKSMELKRDIEMLYIEMAMTDDKSLMTEIKIKEWEQQESVKTQTTVKYNEVKVYVEKWLSFKLDEKTTTVKEYYSYLQVLEKEATKTLKQSNGKEN